MTVCLFTVHMLFPAALAAMSSLHSKQPEHTWAAGGSKRTNTPKLWGAPGWLPHTCHRPGDHAIRDVEHWDAGAAGGALSRHSRERKSAPLKVRDGEKPRPGSIGQRPGRPPPGARRGQRAAGSCQGNGSPWLSIATPSSAGPSAAIHEDMATRDP